MAEDRSNLNNLRGASSWSDWPNHNPYAHLTETELVDLREAKRERYQQAYDFYHACHEDWVMTTKALTLVTSLEDETGYPPNVADFAKRLAERPLAEVVQLNDYRHPIVGPEPPEPLAA